MTGWIIAGVVLAVLVVLAIALAGRGRLFDRRSAEERLRDYPHEQLSTYQLDQQQTSMRNQWGGPHVP